MKSKLYKNYADDIARFLQEGKRGTTEISRSREHFSASAISGIKNRDIEKGVSMVNESRLENNFKSLEPISAIAGKKTNYHQKLGLHPDFSHLKASQGSIEYHYITTMFIDIKKSTDLFKTYYPTTVANISKTIQSAAIHTSWYFDGYIHRLQGDGLMVYFGGKNMTIQQSIDNALNASAFFTYFMKNDLKDMFEEQDIKRIYTRIGIDTGEAEDVLWHLAGMGECSEVTSCSLHSSLSAKMQGQADSNGIIVGDNLLKYTSVKSENFKHKKYQHEGAVSDYIFQIPNENFHYKQHEFGWERYLNSHPQLTKDHEGNLVFKNESGQKEVIQQNLNYLKQNASGYKPYMP